MTADIRAYLEIRTAGASGFSPDGTKVLVSTNLPGTSQLYRLDRDGDGELAQLTAFDEPVGGAYLPTEDRLLLAMDAGGNERHQLYRMDDEVDAPVTSAAQLETLVEDHDHIHRSGGVTRDGRYLAYATNARNGTDFDLHVLDLASGEDRAVHQPGGWASAAGFSPDGRWLASHELTTKPGDNRVLLLDLEEHRAIELAPHGDPAAVGSPSWLPDGQTFYFATDVGREFAAIARGRIVDGHVTWEYVLDKGWDCDCAVDWHGNHLLVTANEDGFSRAYLHDPETLELRTEVPLPGNGTSGGYGFSRDGRHLTFSFSSALVPGDAFLYDTQTGELERLTHSPNDVDTEVFVEPELHRYDSFDGESIPLFVFRPKDPPTAGTKLPVVVVIHGGPEGQYRPAFAPLTQYLVAHGFAVVAPNVRGSTGYGKRYEHLDDVRKRLDSVRDLEGLHDWIATTDDLDPDRAALYGGSYGGYMVLAGLAFQPDRWAAGVDIVGISSLVTFLENTSDYRRAFREREYGSLADDRDFLEEASPITHVDRMRSPLLIIHGANDPRVPLGEAEQTHDILTGKGVRCDLLVYGDEGHGLSKLKNRLHAYPKVAAFLHDVLGG
ncbi:MAG TPA: S9 family peptidase [Nitriliruptorales bacterium]